MIAISTSDLVEILEPVNKSFAQKNRSISLRENRSPLSALPVYTDHIHLAMPPAIPRNSSIYVENIMLDASQAAEMMADSISMIMTLHIASSHMKLTDCKNINKGSKWNNSSNNLAVTVQSFDKQVAKEMQWLFQQITRQNATMGGFKKIKRRSSSKIHRNMLDSARAIESPFAVFAMTLLKFADIKRGNGRRFSTTDIRNALAGEWSAVPVQSDEEELIQAYIAAEAEDVAKSLPRRPGRPQKGLEREQLTRTDEPDQTEYLTRDELNALFRQLAREKRRQRRGSPAAT